MTEDEAIANATPEALADFVGTYRVLKINKSRASKCMREIAKRRENGDTFDYMARIEEHVQKLKGIEDAARSEVSPVLQFVGNFGKATRN
jgi:hypothetical protein